MKNSTDNIRRIYGNVKSCFRQLDMPVQNEDLDVCRPNFWTQWDDGQFYNAMLVVYYGDLDLIKVFSYYNEVPDSRRSAVLEALNKINEQLQTVCFMIDVNNHVILCHGGLRVEGGVFKKIRFRKIIFEILKCVFLYTEAIDRIAASEQTQKGPADAGPVGAKKETDNSEKAAV